MPFPDYTPPTEQFTSQAEIERLLSRRGVILHLDDLDSDDDNYIDDTNAEATDSNHLQEVIDRVTANIMEYLAPRYTIDTLFELPTIRQIATYWACYLLTQRRGNEPLYGDEVAAGLDTLERYRDGSLYLNAPTRGPRVTVQSFVTDNRYHRNPTRVLRAASSNTVSGQRLQWEYPFFWL